MMRMAVSYTHLDVYKRQHPMAIEYKADESTRNVDLSDGEGYISTNGKNWENVEETQSANLCIKAYAKER